MNQRSYDSDLTDAQWGEIEQFLDPPRDCSKGGRPAKHSRRELANAILYQVRTGVQWRYLPGDFPPWPAVWTRFRRWLKSGIWEEIMKHLLSLCRIAAGRDPEPSAVLLDAQSVTSGRLGPRDDIGIDGGKRVKGRKRHLLCDIDGLPVAVSVGSAGRHDSKGGWALLTEQKPKLPRLKVAFADAAYLGLRKKAAKKLDLKITIQQRPPEVPGFLPLKPLWRVERSFAWLNRNRRLRHDYEATIESSQAFAQIAAATLMLHRLHQNGV